MLPSPVLIKYLCYLICLTLIWVVLISLTSYLCYLLRVPSHLFNLLSRFTFICVTLICVTFIPVNLVCETLICVTQGSKRFLKLGTLLASRKVWGPISFEAPLNALFYFKDLRLSNVKIKKKIIKNHRPPGAVVEPRNF